MHLDFFGKAIVETTFYTEKEFPQKAVNSYNILKVYIYQSKKKSEGELRS